MRSFVKIKPSRNGKITLSFINIGKSCLSRDFFKSLICLLMLFVKINFSRKFPNLQYSITSYICITIHIKAGDRLRKIDTSPSLFRDDHFTCMGVKLGPEIPVTQINTDISGTEHADLGRLHAAHR